MIPQLIFLALMFLGLGIHLARHGQPRNENYNFGMALVVGVIYFGLLYWGGFFDCFGGSR